MEVEVGVAALSELYAVIGNSCKETTIHTSRPETELGGMKSSLSLPFCQR